MVYRLGWLAGTAGIVFALARAERLLRPSVTGPPWELVVVTAAVLGAVITWAAVVYRVRGAVIALIDLVAVALVGLRVAVPETTWFVLPTSSSLEALATEMSLAGEVIRTGVAPVIPLPGIVAILAAVFWGMGALLSWGLLTGRPYLAVLTPLAVYLEFAVMDRRPGGWWALSFTLLIGLSLASVALDQRRLGTGLITSGVTRLPVPRSVSSLGAVTLLAALLLANLVGGAVAGAVPRSGYLDWRSGRGLSGDYFGSVSYNPFVGIRQSLVSPTNVPVFTARVTGEVPATSLYWRLVTLDSFDGAQWHIGRQARISLPDDVDRFEPETVAFAGPISRVQAEVTILALQMDWLPAPYAPVDLDSATRTVSGGYRVREDDASLRFDALTYRGMAYVVTSDVPRPDLDVLSRGEDGLPSPLFSRAIAANDFPAAATPLIASRTLPDVERFLRLPEGIDPRITQLARRQVSGLATDFERAVALEALFREGGFRYSTDVVPGHAATDLAAWLTDPESPNYRTGYCEQFATAMAVMARLVGIPSRVVLGFTPGTLQDDGQVVVRDRNAHAWVELWMPAQGWTKFDPTPRGDGVNPPTIEELPFDLTRYLDFSPESPAFSPLPFLRPELFIDEESLEGFDPAPPPRGGDPVESPTGPGGWLVVAALAAATLLAAVPAAKSARRRRRLRRLSAGEVAAAWREIIDRLQDLGEPPHRAATPAEIARRTDPALEPLAAVYAESVYGPDGTVGRPQTLLALRSLEETESRLAAKYPLPSRVVSRYRVGTLLPHGWRGLRR